MKKLIISAFLLLLSTTAFAGSQVVANGTYSSASAVTSDCNVRSLHFGWGVRVWGVFCAGSQAPRAVVELRSSGCQKYPQDPAYTISCSANYFQVVRSI